MAHLKDLIVSGVTRFIGKVYGTITNAIKDDKDQTISSTYIKDISEGGLNTLNITKGDGTSSNVTMSMEPRVIALGNQETSTRSCVTSLGQGISIYTCSNWTDKPAGAPDTQGTLVTVAYNNSSQEMGTEWVWAHQYFMSPFVTYPWVRMGSAKVLTEWTPIYGADIPPSNPNLLINPDFKINQRGFVSGDTIANAEYSLDRWCCSYNNLNYSKSINITSSGIELVTANGAGNGYWGDFHQGFEYPLAPGYYTMSGKIDGEIRTFTGYFEGNSDSVLFDGVFVLYRGSFAIRFGDATRKIEWVKLEVGQAATQFVPPDPATELLKCQRYYYRSGLIAFDKTCLNSHYAVFDVKFPVSMYRIPTVTLYSANGSANTLSTWADRVDSIGSVYVNAPDLCTESFSSITSNNEFTLNQSYSFYYIADAEL